MFKLLVKLVNSWRITLFISAQFIPLFLKFSHRAWLQTSSCAQKHQNLSEYFSTTKYAFLCLLNGLLSPLSTSPIIKTTNYINNFIGDYA